MGRSVNYLSNAHKVFYTTFKGEEDYEWYDFKDNITWGLKSQFPSLCECNRWEGREAHIFLENNLVEIGISEYCGLVSVSIRAKEGKEAIGENWIDKVAANFEKVIRENCGDVYRKIGSFSNGEGVFEKA